MLFNLSGGWWVTEDVIHPMNAMFLGSSDYGTVLEMGPIAWCNSFWGAMLLNILLFKDQHAVLDRGMSYRVSCQPPESHFHHAKHIMLVLAGSWQQFQLRTCLLVQTDCFNSWLLPRKQRTTEFHSKHLKLSSSSLPVLSFSSVKLKVPGKCVSWNWT